MLGHPGDIITYQDFVWRCLDDHCGNSGLTFSAAAITSTGVFRADQLNGDPVYVVHVPSNILSPFNTRWSQYLSSTINS